MAGAGPDRPMVITHDGGKRFAAQIRGHRLVVDQPEKAGGTDSGPMPIELLGAALGTCVAYYVRQFLETRSLDTTGLRVEVRPHWMAELRRLGRFEVQVVVPADLAEPYPAMLERVARSCPAGATLELGSEVEFAFAIGERELVSSE